MPILNVCPAFRANIREGTASTSVKHPILRWGASHPPLGPAQAVQESPLEKVKEAAVRFVGGARRGNLDSNRSRSKGGGLLEDPVQAAAWYGEGPE